MDFYPRPPRGGRPGRPRRSSSVKSISIHALREEGDMRCVCGILGVQRFLSTPSARRATWVYQRLAEDIQHFYPRPPRGGRLTKSSIEGYAEYISIHALREEGDGLPDILEHRSPIFLSTPSARRATGDAVSATGGGNISIHALREEGDRCRSVAVGNIITFLSTPSARRATCGTSCACVGSPNFYPRPPRGGRRPEYR